MATALSIQDAQSTTAPTCSHCTEPATVYLRCDAWRFSAAVCDGCGGVSLEVATERGHAVTLDRVVGVPVVTTVEGIDLAAFARKCCEGLVGDCNLANMRQVPGATTEILKALSASCRRLFSPSEILGVGLAATAAVQERYERVHADLRDTQARLHRPLWRVG